MLRIVSRRQAEKNSRDNADVDIYVVAFVIGSDGVVDGVLLSLRLTLVLRMVPRED